MNASDRIRFIFRERRSFSRASAAAALAKSVRWVESKRFARENGDCVEWEEMVLLANRIWTGLQIHRALGPEAGEVLPRLSLLAPLTVHIPAYKIIAIRAAARRRHLDVSEIVGDSVSVWRGEAEWLERRHPGYVEAWHFPYRD